MTILQNISKDGWKRKEKSNLFPLYIETTSSIETRALAKEFGLLLEPGDVICLEGDLGAGKTTFVKGLGEAFSVSSDEITSPTFVYLSLYENLAHFDLYRIQSVEEFKKRGFDEYLEAPYIACIEWPEPIYQLLEQYYKVSFRYNGENREIKITQERV